MILHRPAGKEPEDAPFKLKIEYKHDHQDKKHSGDNELTCHMVGIRLIMEPLKSSREAIECTEEEKKAAGVTKRTGWAFEYSSVSETENIVL